MPTHHSEILVQVQSIPSEGTASTAIKRLGAGTEATSGGGIGAFAYESFSPDEIQAAIERICNAVTTALTKVSPESCAVEFGLGFKAGAKVPVLLNGEANAAFKITLTWKKK